MACVVYGAFEVASKQAFCDWILEKSANVALGEPLSATQSKALRVEGCGDRFAVRRYGVKLEKHSSDRGFTTVYHEAAFHPLIAEGCCVAYGKPLLTNVKSLRHISCAAAVMRPYRHGLGERIKDLTARIGCIDALRRQQQPQLGCAEFGKHAGQVTGVGGQGCKAWRNDGFNLT